MPILGWQSEKKSNAVLKISLVRQFEKPNPTGEPHTKVDLDFFFKFLKICINLEWLQRLQTSKLSGHKYLRANILYHKKGSEHLSGFKT